MLHKFHSVPEENILYDLNKIELKVALSQHAEILIILTPPHVSRLADSVLKINYIKTTYLRCE